MLHNFNKHRLIVQFVLVILYTTLCSAEVLQFSESDSVSLQNEIARQTALHNIDSLSSYLVNLGYLNSQVYKSNDTLHVTLGDQFSLGVIILSSVVPTTVHIDKLLTNETVTAEIDKIIQIEKDKGYQFATITIDSTSITSSDVNLYCTLQKGPMLYVDSLKFEGLKKSNHSMLHKYFSITDSIISPNLLSVLENDAKRIPYLSFLPPIKQELKQGYQSADIIIPFSENRNILFEGGGGYLSETELFLWNVSFQFQNLFGKGKEVSFLSQKKDENNQQLIFNYRQPFFLLGVGSAQLGVQTRDYRNQFYEFVTNASMKTYYKKKLYTQLSGRYKSVEQDMNPSYRSVELAFAISNKTNYSNSEVVNTFNYASKFSYGNRKYSDDSLFTSLSQKSFNESRIEINTQLVTVLKNNYVMFTNLKFQSFQTDEELPPLAELYLVGGSNSIRSYKDEIFPSIRNLTATFEPQYNFGSGDFFLFYDAGYIYNRTASESNEIVESTIFRSGYGVGISILNDDNSLKISFGWNKELSFDTPRISLQLKTGL